MLLGRLRPVGRTFTHGVGQARQSEKTNQRATNLGSCADYELLVRLITIRAPRACKPIGRSEQDEPENQSDDRGYPNPRHGAPTFGKSDESKAPKFFHPFLGTAIKKPGPCKPPAPQTGKIMMESNKQLAQRGVHSPDFAEALVLSFTPICVAYQVGFPSNHQRMDVLHRAPAGVFLGGSGRGGIMSRVPKGFFTGGRRAAQHGQIPAGAIERLWHAVVPRRPGTRGIGDL
jgi:hypothetical protein